MTVIRKSEKPSLVCFAGNDWWYHNRGLFCPQIMTRFASEFKVLHVNSLGMRVPSLRQDKYALKKIGRKLRSFARFVRKDSNMHVMSPISLPLLGSRFGRILNSRSVDLQVKSVMSALHMKKPVFYVNCPPAIDIVKKYPGAFLIYERTDIFEEMPGVDREYIRSLDRELTETSNLVLYVDTVMHQEGLALNPNSMLIGHGVDFDFFSEAENSDFVPEDIAQIPKPIVGYFGDICDKGFDFELYVEMARSLPHASFVLVGPLSSEVSALYDLPNVHILGQKPYEMIPHYGKLFDVALLPWKVNKWVTHSYPVKIKEYLALGNPFVSIDIPALADFRDVTYLADTHEEYIQQVKRALDDNDPSRRAARKDSVRQETWDFKAKQIIDFVFDHIE